MRKTLQLESGSDTALFDFLTQQKWAAAYQKNQQGQNTFVINNTNAPVQVTLPSPDQASTQPTGNRNVTNTQIKNANIHQPVGDTDTAD